MAKMTIDSGTPALELLPFEIRRINDALTYTLANKEKLTDDDTIIFWDMIGALSELYKEMT